VNHRHLEYPDATTPEHLPSAAIVDLLERGDLDDWQPLAAAIARDPHGALAARVARLVDAYPMYGTSQLWRAYLERARARQPMGTAPRLSLRALRRELTLRQAAVAERMGMAQSDVSKLERRSDARLSTLRRWVEALGGSLRLVASFPDGERELAFGKRLKARRSPHHH
jgi:Helix-turn-helix